MGVGIHTFGTATVTNSGAISGTAAGARSTGIGILAERAATVTNVGTSRNTQLFGNRTIVKQRDCDGCLRRMAGMSDRSQGQRGE